MFGAHRGTTMLYPYSSLVKKSDILMIFDLVATVLNVKRSLLYFELHSGGINFAQNYISRY